MAATAAAAAAVLIADAAPATACEPEVVKNYGVQQTGRFGVIGFRCFCPSCGHLGRRRLNIHSAIGDRRRHGRAS